jgi:hypothetical protein
MSTLLESLLTPAQRDAAAEGDRPAPPSSSRTRDALAWMGTDPARTGYAAARRFGISQAAISSAMSAEQRAARIPTCENCGAPVRGPRRADGGAP